jgi:NAD(P)-dependent dehydrogenase (short-subunit alcohol dehydrogenase family)
MKALVTGGSGGIGRGTVEVLLAEGWDVVATAATERELASLPSSTKLTPIILDVTQDASVRNCVDQLGSLDALVNCAGILRRGEEHHIDVFEQVIAVNLTGTMRMCIACHPLLRQSCGAIVNIASMLSFFGGPLVPAYAASKGGIVQLTKSLAAAWAEDRIRVNAVAPGWIETEMTAPLRADPNREATILNRTPMGRWGRPSEVGEAIAMLLSPSAGFVTGATLPVDGGYSAV